MSDTVPSWYRLRVSRMAHGSVIRSTDQAPLPHQLSAHNSAREVRTQGGATGLIREESSAVVPRLGQ
jgi:hypothetical protein